MAVGASDRVGAAARNLQCSTLLAYELSELDEECVASGLGSHWRQADAGEF